MRVGDFPIRRILYYDMTKKLNAQGQIVYRNEQGQLHREDGPASIWQDGTKFWFVNGKLHREGAPAVEWSHGGREWRIDGVIHRTDGPAMEWPNGRKCWFVNGRPLSEAEFKLREHSQCSQSAIEASRPSLPTLPGCSAQSSPEL